MTSPAVSFSFAQPTPPPQISLSPHNVASLALPASSALFVLLILSYSTVLVKHTRHTFWNYRNGAVRIVLALHALSGLLELTRFHLLSLTHPPLPTSVDLALCLTQSLTNLFLSRPLRRGQPTLVHPSYQAGAILRPLLSLYAWYFRSPETHAASVLIIHGFIYTRLLIWLFNVTGALRKGGEMYTVAVFGAGVLACADTSVPHLEKVYILTVGGVAALNRWTSAQLSREGGKSHLPGMRQLLDVLVLLGFCELETIQARGRSISSSSASSDGLKHHVPVAEVSDEYCDQTLSEEPSF